MPYMLYASIPVFGATWFAHSWFGVAVQWNGLDYAYALFDLAKYDDSFPWEQIARGLTVSALYQQETSERYTGLYPDSYNFMDRTTSAWKLSPALIIRNLYLRRRTDIRGQALPFTMIASPKYSGCHCGCMVGLFPVEFMYIEPSLRKLRSKTTNGRSKVSPCGK